MPIAKPRMAGARGDPWRRALGFVAAAPLAVLGTAIGFAVALVAVLYAADHTRAAKPDAGAAGPEGGAGGAGGIVEAITGEKLGSFVERAVRSYTERELAIRGGLGVDLSWPTVTISAKDVSFANATWTKRPDMLEVESMRVRLDVAALLTGDIVVPLIELTRPRLYLATNDNGESNLPFPTGGSDKGGGLSAGSLPLVRDMTITDATLGYRNLKTGVDAEMRLDRASFKAPEGEPMRLSAEGVYEGQPLKIDAEGGAWSALGGQPDEAFPLDLRAALGGFTARAMGTLAQPLQMKGVDLSVQMDGERMPTVYPFSEVFVAPTPAVDLKARLTDETGEQGRRWTLADLDARLGRSEITGGRLTATAGGPRPRIEGNLQASRFWFDDITSFFSAPDKDKGTGAKAENSGVLPEDPFWPLAIFDLADVNVDLRLGQFHGFGLDFDMLAGKVTVDDGVLQFEPLRGTRGDAEAVVYLSLYSNAEPTKTDVKVELKRLSLDRIVGDVPVASVPLAGRLGGKGTLGMQGNSIARMLGTANGEMFLAMDDGQLSGLLMELLGLDIVESLGLVVTEGDEDTPVPIRCAVADMALNDGKMKLRHFLIDTADTLVTAEGAVGMGDETIDLRVVPYPKDFSLLSLRSPIGIEGTFAEPEIFTDPAGLGVETTADKVINAILTPIAGLLPPYDSGADEAGGCTELKKEAGGKAGQAR